MFHTKANLLSFIQEQTSDFFHAAHLNDEDSSSSDEGFVILTLDHLSGPFLALILLHVMTLPVFGVELCVGRWKVKRKDVY